MNRALSSSWIGVFLIFATSQWATAQSRISGKVVDPAGRPVGGIEVLLHAVQESSGNEIDRDTAAADGTFNVTVKSGGSNAVYFVAVVYNGELFIGDLLRLPFPLGQDYLVQVGVNAVDLSPAAAGTLATPEETKSSRTAGIVVIIAALALIGGILRFALKRRPAARRRWLVELARLEEDIATAADSHGILHQRRAEIRARLRAPASG